MIPTVDNIIAVYRRATVDQYLAGTNWYPSALELSRELDPRNPNRAAGIISAFSPQCPWDRNVELARRFFAENGLMQGGQTTQCMDKARAIYNGGDPAIVLGGKKTTAFYHNIMDPISPAHVTVDVHAFEIAVGAINPKATTILARKGVYEAFSDAYRAAASLFNIPAPTMQAITWTVWRDEKEIEKKKKRGKNAV